MLNYLFFCAAFLLSFCGIAQHTQTYTTPDKLLRNGMELLDKKLFTAAKTEFETYLQQPLQPEQRMQGEYYSLLAKIKLGELPENQFITFTKQYPTSWQTATLYQQLVDYSMAKDDYEHVIQYAEPIKTNNPTTLDEYRTCFQLGYAYFMKQRYEDAKPSFDAIKNENNLYMYAASYYAGYIEYTQQNDTEALADLGRARNDATYQEEAEKIIPLVYYRRKEYEEVIKHGLRLKENQTPLSAPLLLVLGDSYFQLKEYLQAAKNLDMYAENQPDIDRTIAYKLAYSLSEIGDNLKAQAYFSIVAEGTDSLAQHAAYNLGISCLAVKRKEPAIHAFDKARKMTFSTTVQEKAAVDYAKVCYELKDFSRCIEGCEYVEKTFPKSKYLEETASLLADSYLHAGNYVQALQYIEKTPTKSKKLQATYQRLAYNEAVDRFNKDDYSQAEIFLRKSLKYPINKDLSNSSTYYLAEMYSYDEKYDSALLYYNRLPNTSVEFKEAFYGKGYAAYNKKDYTNASTYFNTYLTTSTNTRNKADAQIRLADCYYVTKDYEQALQNYDKALHQKNVDTAYIYFQKGIVLVNQEKYDEALASFDKLVLNDVQATYYEQALYQKGLLHVELTHIAKAVELFTQLIETKTQGVLVPNALSKRASCYLLVNDTENAINDFKTILQTYPTHEVAEDAVQGLQEMKEKGHEIANYDVVVEKFSHANPQSKAALEGEYASAKSNYDNANYAKAIMSLQNFTKKYADTELVGDAYYFLAASYDQTNDLENAVTAYAKVKGSYETRALQRLAELELQRGKYLNAHAMYERMLKNTLNKRYEGNALAGLLQCNFYLQKYDKVQELANQLYSKNHTKFWSLADVFLAKVHIEKQEYAAALLQLQKTMQNSQDSYAAEAQYLVGVILRTQKKYDESTKALIEVRTKYSAYPAWVYEAFLLLAENYINLQNTFQAKATLQSIIDASDDEKVKQRAKQRLDELGK